MALVVCHSPGPGAYAERGLAEVGVTVSRNWAKFDLVRMSARDTYKTGYSIGGFLRYDFLDWFAFQAELLYAPRGSIVVLDEEVLGTFSTRYLDVPILARISTPRWGPAYGHLVAGPSMSYLLTGAAEDGSGMRDLKNDLRSFDFGGVVGVGASYEVTSRWAVFVELRYNAGFLDIFPEASSGRVTKNQSVFLSIGFGHAINDSDGDGIINRLDQCPNEPEDFDGFQDADGCPDPDNDGDGIPDDRDACPDEPEDFDGFEDEDGCPDPDNDGDGFLDEVDRCPNEPFPGNDGCPPEYERLEVTRTMLAFKEGYAIQFDRGRAELSEEHLRTLDEVAQVLADYPRMRLRIEGHADGEGNDETNLRLSERRAREVFLYLTVRRDIPRERLEDEGFSARKPIAYEESEAGKRKNRRVELMIIEER